MYVITGKSIPQIAALLPVSEKTLYLWSKKGGWPEQKQVRFTISDAVTRLRNNLACKIAALSDNMTAADVDEIAKIASSIRNIERGSMDMKTAAVEVMDYYVKFLGGDADVKEIKLHSKRIQGFFEWLELNA